MNFLELLDEQEANRAALGDEFAEAGAESRAVTKARRKSAEEAVKADQAKAFEQAIEDHLAQSTAAKAETDNAQQGQE